MTNYEDQEYSLTALQYHEAGWSPLPMLVNDKTPFIAGWHGKKAPYPDAEQVEAWTQRFPGARVGLRLAPNVCGIDIDVRHGGDKTLATLEVQIGTLPATISSTARDDGSRIMFFKIPDDREWCGTPGKGIDFIHAGNRYAVVWPSIHDKVGTQYRWYDSSGELIDTLPHAREVVADLPDSWVEFCTRKKTGHRPPGDYPILHKEGTYGTRLGLKFLEEDSGPKLAKLAKTKGHNNALYSMTKRVYELVAGGELDDEYVKATFLKAAEELYAGWEDDEVENTIESARNNGLESPRTVTVDEGDEDAGWLLSKESHLMSSMAEGQQWGDFDIEVQGVIETEGNRQYDIVLKRKRDGAAITALLPAAVVTNNQALTRWLANYGCTVTGGASESEWLKKIPNGVRLLRYLESQGAPPARVTPYLGWDNKSDAFLTQSGVILGVPNETGLSPFRGVRPDPAIKENDLVNCHYGFEADEDTAKQVLGEVMQFHFPQFTAVMGSFMVACVLKGQLDRLTDVWPYPIVEAASGASKSNGFMPMIQQLMGRKGRSSVFTESAMKSALASHRCLPEWIDDPDDVKKLGEVLRLCSSKGGSTKKGGDNWRRNEKLVFVTTPIVTAESLGLMDQKAYADRAISLNPEKPNHRRSVHDDSKYQIDDIKDLEIRYEDELSCMAGHVVSMILQRRHMANPTAFREFKTGHSGRHADKLAILLIGATVLVDILGDDFDWIFKEVDAWTKTQVYNEGDNRLTKTIVRQYIAQHPPKDRPAYLDKWQVYTPVILTNDKDGNEALWVNLQNLAIWWEKSNFGKIEERTDTEVAMRGQAKALGMSSRSSADKKKGENEAWIWPNIYKVVDGKITDTRTKMLFQRLPDAVTSALLDGDAG